MSDLFLSSIGCLNLTGPLRHDEDMVYADSRRLTAELGRSCRFLGRPIARSRVSNRSDGYPRKPCRSCRTALSQQRTIPRPLLSAQNSSYRRPRGRPAFDFAPLNFFREGPAGLGPSAASRRPSR